MKALITSFLSSGFSGGESTQFIRKIRFLNASCIILIAFSLFLIIQNLRIGQGYIALLEGLIIIVLAIIILFLRMTKNLESSSSLFLLLLVNVSQFLLITNSVTGFAIMWIFSFPVIAFLLKEESKALLWCIAEFVGLFAVCVLAAAGVTTLGYTLQELFVISIGFFFFSLLMKYLIGTSRVGEQVLMQKSNDLYKSNMQLAKEIRERKDTELTLKQENVRDEAIFSSMGEGMIVLDQDCIIVMINKAAKNLLSCNDEELRGKVIYDKIHLWTEDKKRVPRGQDIIAKSFDSKQMQESSDFLIGHLPENAISVALIVSPILLYQKVVGGVVTFRDISQEKEVDRMKTEFISLASHQLRTPLTAMKWFLEMLLSGDLGEFTEDQKKYLQNVSDSNEKEITLVNSLLNISRIESGRIIIDPIPTQMNDLITEAAKEQEVLSDSKNQKVSLVLDESLPKIPLDNKMVREVILNLLTNSIKYSSDHASIVISTTQDENNIILKITDTGYGIPENEQKRLFQRFFRASNVMKIVTEGTGLGLYLVKKIIDASSGTISVESREGQGTEFTITLPKVGMKEKKGEAKLT